MSAALKLTIIFLCVAAVLTFYSKTIYNTSIPTVQTSLVKADTLRIVYQGEGVVEPRETISLYAPEDLVVTEVLAGKYDVVSEEDVLAVFDVSGLENQLKDLNSLLNKQRTEWASAWTNTIEMDMDDTERHMKNLRAQIEKGRELAAPFDGIVTGVYAQPGMMAGRYTPLFELGNTELGYVIRDVIPMEYSRFFSKANVEFAESIYKTTGTIISRAAAPGGGVEIAIELEQGRTKLRPGMLATFELSHYTEPLPALVPVTAIVDGAFVFKLIEADGPFGKEYRVVRIPVTVGFQSEGWVAVTGDIYQYDKVVISSDRPLSDERVKIYQGE